MYNHIIPCGLFNLIELYIMFGHLDLTILPHLHLHPVSIINDLILCGDINDNFVFI
jgi:hypothetical protein